jgi:hypothetical protein
MFSKGVTGMSSHDAQLEAVAELLKTAERLTAIERRLSALESSLKALKKAKAPPTLDLEAFKRQLHEALGL